jgi:hypothetical protein
MLMMITRSWSSSLRFDLIIRDLGESLCRRGSYGEVVGSSV